MVTISKNEARELATHVHTVRLRIVQEHKNLNMRKGIPREEIEEASAMLRDQERALYLCQKMLTGLARINGGRK